MCCEYSDFLIKLWIMFRISYKNRWIMLLEISYKKLWTELLDCSEWEISYKKTLDRVVGLFRVGDFL